jgi:tryptophan-rich sensory protein
MLKDRRDWTRLIISLLLCLAAGGIAVLFAGTSLPSWYQQLEKPAPLLPIPLFGAVWPLLYLLMGVALYLIWRQTPLSRATQTALVWFFVQLIIGLAWAWFFFGLRLPFFGVMEVALLWFSVFITLIAFLRLSKPAALLLLPYWLWVSCVLYLNWHIWKLN